MKHLERDLERLSREILAMGKLVEDATARAMEALLTRDAALAERVIAGDRHIDLKEIEVEEECLKVLALHQPVAADLRFIIAVLKVNNDLERMGDLALNIAERAQALARGTSPDPPSELRAMMEKVQSMVVRALDALVSLDVNVARSVLVDDEIVDDMHRRMYQALQDRMAKSPERIPQYVQYLSVSRYLERIADQSTNIAEDIIFTAEGEVVRHGRGLEMPGTGRPRPRIVPSAGG
ncbi:MAG: phosphate signaling complex protein PhoU [bacterium]